MKNFDKILSIIKGVKMNDKSLSFVECFDFIFDLIEFEPNDPLMISDELLVERINKVMDTSQLDFHFVSKDDINDVEKLVKENKELKKELVKLKKGN